MESTAAHLQQLRTEAEKTYDILFDTDSVNGFIDILDKLLGEMNDLISGMGGGVAVVTRLGAAITNLLSKQIGTNLNQTINNVKSDIDKFVNKKSQTDWINTAKGQVKQDYEARGISSQYDENSKAVQKEAELRADMLKVSQQLTKEQIQQLANNEQTIGDLQREIEEINKIESSYKNSFQKEFGKENVEQEELDKWYDSQNQYINDLSSKYESMKNTIDEMGDLFESKLTYTEGLADVNTQIQELLENESISENKKYQLKLLSYELDKSTLTDEEKAELVEQNKSLILDTQKGILEEQQALYDEIYDAGEKQIELENGKREELQKQSDELERQSKDITDNAERSQKISKIIQGISGGIEIASSLIGTLQTGLDETATGADKANALFAGFSGALSGAADMLFPGSGILVQGVFALGKGILEVTGLWDNFENALKSTDERLEELNSQMREFANSAKTYNTARENLEEIEEEYEKLSFKAGLYDKNINDLTNNERSRYNELKNIILQYNEEALLGYNDRGEAILKQNEGIQETIDLLKEQYELERSGVYTDDFEKNTKTKNDVYNDAKKNIENISSTFIPETLFTDLDSFFASSEQYSEQGVASYVAMKEAMEQFSKGLIDTSEYYSVLKEQLEKLKEEGDKLGNSNLSNLADNFLNIIIENNNALEQAQLELEKSSIIDGSWVAGVIKYNENYNKEYSELEQLAKLKGIEDIDSYILNYTNGLLLGSNDISNYEDAYAATQEFITKITEILSNNPDLIKNINSIGEEFGEQSFSSYQDYINKLIAQMQKILDEHPELKELDESVLESIFGAAFGTGNINIDNGVIQAIDTQFTDIVTKIKDKISEAQGTELTGEEKGLLNKLLGDVSESDYNYILNNIDETIIKTQGWQEALSRVNEELERAKQSSSLVATSDALNTLHEGGSLSSDQITQLEKLEEKYTELGDAFESVGRDAKEYIEILEQVQQTEEDALQESLRGDLANAGEDFQAAIAESQKTKGKTELEVTADMDAVTEAIDNVFDKKYELEIALTDDILSDVDAIVDKAENAALAVGKIGQNFEIAADDAEEVLRVFPELAEGAKVLQDGTIQLANELTSTVLSGYGAQIDADKQKTAVSIDNRIKELEAEKARVQATLEEVQNENVTKERLEEITKEYALQADEEITTSDKATADAAITNSGVMAQAIIDNWAACATAAKEYGAIAAKAAAGEVPTGTVTGGKVVSSGATVEASSSSGSSKNQDEALVKQRKVVEEQLKKQVESYEKQIADLTISKSKMLKSVSGIEDAAKSGLASKDKKSGGGGGSKEKERQEKELKNLDDEFDKYWKLKKAIDATDRAIQKLEKDQENLYGYQLIDSLKKENELLEVQKGNYEALLAAQNERAAALRAELGTMGVIFDASGAIVNYAEATAQALAAYNLAIQQYNAGLIDETTLGVAEKAFENFKKLLEEYDKLYYTEIQETQDKLDEIRRKELANNLKAWQTEIQVKLDKKQLKRDWNDFFKEINEDFKKLYKDLRIEQSNLLANAKTYLKNDGTINVNIQAAKEIMAEIDKMMAGGTSDKFESVSQAQEELKKFNEQIQSAAKELYDSVKQAWQNYLDGIDQVQDKLDAVQKRYEDINAQIEFQGKLIKLLYGETDTAYKLLSKYYEGMIKSTSDQIDAYKNQAEMWKAQFEKSGADINRPDSWNEDQSKLYEKWQNAQQKLNDLVIEQIELLQNDYKNTIDSIVRDLEKEITGSRLSTIQDEWEQIQKTSEGYYDNIESLYQIQTLANKFDESIASTTSLKNQQKLQKLREKEINELKAILEERKEVSEYEVKAAEAKYQIALQEIALEEAQNNKTSMKLTRNEQGNWSYQYVSDEDDVLSKRQALLDSYNDLYQLASNAYQENLEKIQELTEEFLTKQKEIKENEELTEEEKQIALDKLRSYYYERYNKLAIENDTLRNDLASATAATLKELYDQDEANLSSMTEEEQQLVKTLADEHISDFSDVEDAVKDNYKQIGDKAKQVCSETKKEWNSGAQEMINRWAADNGTSVKASVEKAYDKMKVASDKYKAAVEKLADQVEMDFGESGITGAINKAEEATNDLKDATEDLAEEGSTYIDSLRKTVEDLEEAWNKVKDAIQEAINLIEEYLNKVAEANAASASTGNAGGGDGGAGSGDSNSQSSSPSSNSSNPSGGQKHSWAVYNPAMGSNAALAHFSSEAEAAAWVRRNGGSYYQEYKTGGYTGEWGEDGRLAMLHQKELVLNKKDTENFLSGISMIRDMTSLNGSIENSILKSIANMALQITGISPGLFQNNNSNNTQSNNTFNITAEFPNANNVDDIRQAILTLPNIASQFINSNSR